MNKNLETFERFRDNIRWLEENTLLKHYFENDELHLKEDLDIIETTLKENINLKIRNEELVKTNKELLARINGNDFINFKVLQKLKALEIIKKEINGCLEFCYDEEHDYGEVWCVQNEEENRVLIASANSKEEYDLLKEVLIVK